MSRTKKLNCKKAKEKKSKAFLRNESEGPSRREEEEEKYICVVRKGRPGVLSDDWLGQDRDLYEYLVNHEMKAA